MGLFPTFNRLRWILCNDNIYHPAKTRKGIFNQRAPSSLKGDSKCLLLQFFKHLFCFLVLVSLRPQYIPVKLPASRGMAADLPDYLFRHPQAQHRGNGCPAHGMGAGDIAKPKLLA